MTDRQQPVTTRRAVVLGTLATLGGCSAAGNPSGAPSGAASGSSAPHTPTATVTQTPSPTPTVTPTPAPSPTPTSSPSVPAGPSWARADLPSRASVVEAYAARPPGAFGLDVRGVLSRLEAPVGVALTFDACGGSGGGTGYDAELIGTLRERAVPATLFLNLRWITANPALAAELAADPLFEIECHGTRHLPLSMTGQAAYGIAGTANAGEVFDEVTGSQEWFWSTLQRAPWFFRSGTAHVDEASAAMARELGSPVANFSINADYGATAAPSAVAQALRGVKPGDIVIGHMNRPGRGTAAGVAQAVPGLLDKGVTFVRLADGFLRP